MVTVVISPRRVVKFLDGGGHFWVYMQYVQGLHQLGCEVYWLERFHSSGDQVRDALVLSTFVERMERYGLAGKLMLYVSHQQSGDSGQHTYLGMTQREAEALLRRADLLLNFDYSIDPALLSCLRRTALVDIDPGLLQFWMATRQLIVPPHDVYLTTGETVGTPSALFPDGGSVYHRVQLVGGRMDNGWYRGLREQQAGLISGVHTASEANEPTARVGALLRRWGRAGPPGPRGPRLARTPFPRSRRNAGDVSSLYPEIARRVQLRETVLHEVPERLDQRPDLMLFG